VRSGTGPQLGRTARAILALLSDQHGSGFVSALVLVCVLALGAAGAIKGLGNQIGEKLDCTGEAIMSLTPGAGRCQGEINPDVPVLPGPPPGAREPAPSDSDSPPEVVEGPALVDAGPIVALPFPGTVAISCTAVKGQKDTCKDETGVRVQASGELSIERTPTRLDLNGCPKQDLGVSTKLQVELSGKAKGKTVGGTLAVFTGSASKFKVTVSPEEADAIARGDRPPPNPLDPASIEVGEIVELSEEFFAGHKLQGTYRALQAELGFEEGRRLSSGVRRIDPRTVRIFVGDSDFVRQALSFSANVGEFGVTIGGREELSSGNLRAIDIDIGTAAGFEAYQRFLAEGKLPPPDAPGTKDPTTSETVDFSDTAKIEAKLGRIKLGGVLGDSEGHILETRHADGRLDTTVSGRFNDVGLTIRRSESPGGSVEKDFSLLLEGVDRTTIENFEFFSGRPLHASPDGNVRLDFSEADLRQLQEQAFDQVFQRVKDHRENLSREDLERMLREDPNRLSNAGLNDPFTFAFEIATAKSPEEVLHLLYLMGTGGDSTRALDSLLGFIMETTRARNGLREIPKDHPESNLPGEAVAPKCS
jgi:hypothetical protein